ncbi:hypothetical protein WH7805_08771 [Synechococcus sp. WH 7805]|nr:hypothetical protein WH7805_08771 [Synechococcus sp. WH 7805]
MSKEWFCPGSEAEAVGNSDAEVDRSIAPLGLACLRFAHAVDQIRTDEQGAPRPAQLFCGQAVGSSFASHGDRQPGNHMPDVVGVANAVLQIGVFARNGVTQLGVGQLVQPL